MVVIIVIVIAMLNGCLYDTQKRSGTGLPVTYDDNYITSNIDLAFSYLNENNFSAAHKILRMLDDLEAGKNTEMIIQLGLGIYYLNISDYIKAERCFRKSVVFTESHLGIIHCSLQSRNISDLETAGSLLESIPDGFQSDIYSFFDTSYILGLKACSEFWSSEDTQYYERLKEAELASVAKMNHLANRLIKEMEETSSIGHEYTEEEVILD